MSKTKSTGVVLPHALLDELGIAEDDRLAFMLNLDKAARALTSSPKQELQWRLNARLRGDDPGPSVNWAGERGLRG